jgi:rare lipoprotein A (peptidoglycan hydrolase)
MDTTYFGRKLGVMAFKDSISGHILYKQYVKQETNKLYLSGIEEIARRGIKIQAIICDGRKGLLQLFEGIPNVQLSSSSHYRRYLKKKPKMQACKEFWTHVQLLTKTDKESFEGGLAAWYGKWENFSKERKKDANGKNRYVHKRLRSAYRSLKTNLPWLFPGIII